MSAFTQLDGKVAVVTGAASGIGLGIARRLKAQGMQLVLADIEAGPLQAAAAELGGAAVRTDVSSADSVEALAAETDRRFGRVDLVVNNAGVGSAARIADMTMADWRWILDVNLYGVIHGISAFLPRLLANPDGGHIVNTASMSGLRPRLGIGGYAASKYGVVGISEVLAQELEGTKVGVTVLCPGMVRSNIGASSRNRPSVLSGGSLKDIDMETAPMAQGLRWIDADEAGEVVVRAVRRGDLYAITHPEQIGEVQARFDGVIAAFRSAAADRS